MRVSRHNGRSGSHGTYNPKHNDREFDVDKADDIRDKMTPYNIYWNCIDKKRGISYRHDQNNTNRYLLDAKQED